eukprot:Lankesteria_metandrocarpae@DN4102_c0_g1_i1.p1
MAIGKNKRITKGRKGGKSKHIDPFVRKEWYFLKAPAIFSKRDFGLTLCNKSQGRKLAADSLKSRVFQVSLADLQDDEDQSYRKIKLCTEDIQGKNCLTDFYGMDMTRDRLCRLVRKWHSLIEAHCDVKTADGYHLRMFCIAFTERRIEQVKSTCYAQTSKIKVIRKSMVDTMTAEAAAATMGELVKKFIAESVGRKIETECRRIYPIKDVHIRKVKVLRKPKFDAAKILQMHQDATEEAGVAVSWAAEDSQNLLTQELQT